MQGIEIAELYTVYKACTAVYIDTRKSLKGGLFFALGQKNTRGVHRGNAFAEQALESGQAAFVVINDPDLKQKYLKDNRFIFVEDAEKALQALAAYHRNQLDIPIFAIAGSNGKTTTKELVHSVLSLNKKVFSTKGNLNNHLGVPLSLLSIDAQYDVAILEIGANHLGETAFLANLIAPDYGLVTNCGKDHLGEYGSVENIVRANKELYDVLAERGKIALVHEENAQLVEMSAAVENRLLYGSKSALKAKITQRPMLGVHLSYKAESITLNTQLFGAFWLDTVLNVAAVALELGCTLEQVKKGIEAYKPAALRSELLNWKGAEVILDCYNANPSSMEVFLDEIEQSNEEKSTYLVLGEMLELGDYSKAEHQILVDRVVKMKAETVLFVGACFDPIDFSSVGQAAQVHHLKDYKAVAAFLEKEAVADTRIYVKGSRGNRLEQSFGRTL